MNEMMRDVKYALRQLMKAPGFTVTAVLTLALGIGANAAIFTLVHAVLMRHLPVPHPEQLVRVGDEDDCCVNGGFPDKNKYSLFAYDLYLHLRDNTPEFEQLAAMQAGAGGGSVIARKLSSSSPAQPGKGEYVSGNYFAVFGVQPAAGRLLQASDDVANAAPVVVMGYQTWKRDFALDPAVVGSTFELNAHPFTVIGVAPEGFYGDRLDVAVAYYMPMSQEPVLDAASPMLHRKASNWVYLLGRVKPGVQLGPLAAKMSGALRQWLGENVAIYKTEDGKVQLGKTTTVLIPGALGIANTQEQYATGLHLLMGIAGLVLLIACANIANLVLVRGLARRAETSIRMALGASRPRLIRQILTESVVLSVLGGLAGLAVAYAGAKALLSLVFGRTGGMMPIDAAPSPVVLGFAFAISLLTGVVFGLAPAWITSHGEPAEALRGSGRSTKEGGSLVQKTLVVVQAALSLVLLVGAGLLTRSLNKLEHQDFGLQTDHRVIVHVSPQQAGYTPEQLPGLYPTMYESLKAIPGVERVGMSLYTPLEGNNWGEGVTFAGRPPAGPREDTGASWVRANPDYFEAIGQKVVKGRGLSNQDTETSRGVAVVNEAFVRKFFKNGAEPIGAHFGTEGPESVGDLEIVGVMKDVMYNNPRRPVRAMYMRPLLQKAASNQNPKFEAGSTYIGALVIQAKGSTDGLEAKVRKTLSSINSNLTVIRFETFDEQISGQFTQDRIIARLTMLFGLLALILAAVGLYGVTAYTVARRTPEIGIRMALGAARGSVVKMVLRDAMLQAGIGLVIGIPVALLCVRFVKSQLFEVSGNDVGTLAAAAGALALAALVAGVIPARRAASTDPVRALRAD